MKMKSLGLAFWLLAFGVSASSQGLLKPQKGTAQVLRAKSLNAEIEVRGAFAQTLITTTYQNETSRQTEADFQYDVPDGAVVTGFAYWFKGEKVVARVVEKERAAQIYSTIRNQNRDPALIEQIDKNTFRARIFPIEANADLKVEMSWVQVLNADEKGALLTFPLKSQESGKGTLENLDVRVRVVNDASFSKVVNNYKLSPLEDKGAQVLQLSEKNYRAEKDLIVRLERPLRALNASLFAARSGGRDGFFALALTPNQNLKTPRLKINGVATYQVLPARLPDLRANETFVVVGRYKPSARASAISLSGFGKNTARQNLSFSSSREDNNLATKLWAAMQIEKLSPNQITVEKNRERIVELSTRFTLPSFLTSWLAVPKSEWENFKRQIAWNDIQRYGPALAKMISEGKGRTSKARKLREKFNAACRIAGEKPASQLAEFIAQYREQDYYDWEAKRNEAARAMARATAEGKTRTATRLRRRVAQWNRKLGVGAGDAVVGEHQAQLWETAQQWAHEKDAARPNAKKLRALENRIARLSPVARVATKTARVKAGREIIENASWSVGADIAIEIAAGRGEGEKVKELRAAFERRARRLGANAGLENVVAQRVADLARSTAQTILDQRWAMKPDEALIAREEGVLANLVASEAEREKLLLHAEENWSWRRDNFATEIVTERAKEKPDAARLAYLQRTLERTTRAALRRNQNAEFEDATVLAEAKQLIKRQEQQRYQWEISNLKTHLAIESALSKPNAARVAELEKSIAAISARLLEWDASEVSAYDNSNPRFNTARQLLETEHRQLKPDATRVRDLEKEFIRLSPFDDWPQWGNGHKINDVSQYAKARAERIKVRIEGQKLDAQLNDKTRVFSPEEKMGKASQRAQLLKREKELAVRMGDPLISVEAPADAAQVVAIFPGGETKKLALNADSQKWEVRFDVPTYAMEGAYWVSIIVVFEDGTRQHLTMRFHVDVTAPQGKAKAAAVGGEGSTAVWRLEMDGDDDTARVLAILPGGEKIELAPSTEKANRFFALAPRASVAEVEVAAEGSTPFAGKGKVIFILTDRAHNRTTIEVDMSE